VRRVHWHLWTKTWHHSGSQQQSDYMKTWLNEKHSKYLQKILEMKANPQLNGSGEESSVNGCPRCGLGRPVWHCIDCTDKRPLCILCCRQTHWNDIFHCIEKWNGWYFQQGALWQVRNQNLLYLYTNWH
jgi:hypothetical protein